MGLISALLHGLKTALVSIIFFSAGSSFMGGVGAGGEMGAAVSSGVLPVTPTVDGAATLVGVAPEAGF